MSTPCVCGWQLRADSKQIKKLNLNHDEFC